MAVDMLDFGSEELYFDEPMQAETRQCLDRAAQTYGEEEAEHLLLRAYFLEPEHPMVQVALYRYFFYQHRYRDALLIAERVLQLFAARLGLPPRWQDLKEKQIGSGVMVSMTYVRFYMLALKGAGYLELRLGDYDSALQRLQKVVEVDTNDRLGAAALLQVAQEHINYSPSMASA